MGWFSQGYLRELDYSVSPPKFIGSWWKVGNSSGINPAIDQYEGLLVEGLDPGCSIEILYGPSCSEYFHGCIYYSGSESIANAKRRLLPFKGLPVYKEKHGNQLKSFEPEKLIYLSLGPLVLFYEIRKEWSDEEWELLIDYFNRLDTRFPGHRILELTNDLTPRYW